MKLSTLALRTPLAMTSMKKSAALVLMAALGLDGSLALGTGTNSTYDLSRDFSKTNPGMVWSYGSMETLGGAFTPFPALLHENERDGGSFAIWAKVGGGYPAVYYNDSTQTVTTEAGQGVYPPGTVLLLPGMEGNPDNYGVIRFTLPTGSQGTYHLRSMVQPYLQGPTSHDCDFHILKNGAELFGRFLPPNGGTNYSDTLTLASGDIVDFVIGRGQDNRLFASGLKVEATLERVSPLHWVSAQHLWKWAPWIIAALFFLMFGMTAVVLLVLIAYRRRKSVSGSPSSS